MAARFTTSLHTFRSNSRNTFDHFVFAMLCQIQEINPSHLVVQVTELLHQVLGDALAVVGLVVGHTVLGIEADAAHAPLLLRGVLQQAIVLGQVVDGVPVRTMDPGCSKFQSGFTCGEAMGLVTVVASESIRNSDENAYEQR